MSPKVPSSEKIYGIYVIDLDPKVWIEKKRMRDANPDYDSDTGMGCVYVGMSKDTPTVRFGVHIAGGFTASPVVRDFGRRVQRRRSKSFKKDLTKAEAEEREPQEQRALTASGAIGTATVRWELVTARRFCARCWSRRRSPRHSLAHSSEP